MLDRRSFLASMGGAAVALDSIRAAEALASLTSYQGGAQEIAADESYWFKVQQAFTVDRSIINLNSGGVSPTPAIALEAQKRHLDYTNSAPAYTLWRNLVPQKEGVRTGLARFFGCDPEEIALTRNSSEALQICQSGIDLKAGDEVLCCNQDYPRMVNQFKQRERREGIVLKMFPIPVPCEDPAEIVKRFADNITAKTKLILTSHIINITGQILPTKQICALGRSKGIPVIVDGAHSFAHWPFTQKDLDCDYYATSLHKWLFAPIGTGMLFVKKDKIEKLWPLQAAGVDMDADIRKFEEIGTHPVAQTLAIAEALSFHQGIGPERKAERLRYLRNRWANSLLKTGKVKLHTSLKPEFSCGIGTFSVEGMDPGALHNHLWDKHRIYTTPIGHDDVKGVRITASVWSTLDEIDRFTEAVENATTKGIK